MEVSVSQVLSSPVWGLDGVDDKDVDRGLISWIQILSTNGVGVAS